MQSPERSIEGTFLSLSKESVYRLSLPSLLYWIIKTILTSMAIYCTVNDLMILAASVCVCVCLCVCVLWLSQVAESCQRCTTVLCFDNFYSLTSGDILACDSVFTTLKNAGREIEENLQK